MIRQFTMRLVMDVGPKMRKANLFGGKGSEGYNALYQAILDCGEQDYRKEGHYGFLENTPITSLTSEIVDKLRENGFEIMKRKDL
jgi:hypothetical protein